VKPFPPDVFWIAPGDSVVEGIGHLTMMREDPETFGMPSAPKGRAEIDAAFTSLMRDGWVRGLYDVGPMTLDARIGRPSKVPLANLANFVRAYASQIRHVIVKAAWPRSDGCNLSAEKFLAEKFPKSWLKGLK